jgi:hypothetical protein
LAFSFGLASSAAAQPVTTPPASGSATPAADTKAGAPKADPAKDKKDAAKDKKDPAKDGKDAKGGAPAAPEQPATGGQAATQTGPSTTQGTPSAGTTTAAPSGTMDGQTYAVRLRDLEQKIDELKEQIRRSHTRLSLLSDTILSGGGAGSRSVIRFKNELSDAFLVTRALFVLDGAVQYNKSDQSGALSDQPEIPIFNGSIPPGDHTLQVLVNLQGHGYGVFSYLRGYKFEVRSSHSFTAVEGKTVTLDAIAYEKGSVTTPLEERPAVRYLEKIVSGLADAGATAPTNGAPNTTAK